MKFFLLIHFYQVSIAGEKYLGQRLYEVEVGDISELPGIVNNIYFVSSLEAEDAHPQIKNIQVAPLTMDGDNEGVYMKVMQIISSAS